MGSHSKAQTPSKDHSRPRIRTGDKPQMSLHGNTCSQQVKHTYFDIRRRPVFATRRTVFFNATGSARRTTARRSHASNLQAQAAHSTIRLSMFALQDACQQASSICRLRDVARRAGGRSPRCSSAILAFEDKTGTSPRGARVVRTQLPQKPLPSRHHYRSSR